MTPDQYSRAIAREAYHRGLELRLAYERARLILLLHGHEIPPDEGDEDDE